MRRQSNCPVYRLHTHPEQPVIVVDSSPSLAIKAVGNIELRWGVFMRRIRAIKGGPSRLELIAAEEAESLVKRLLVDLVRPDVGGKAAGDFGEGLRLVHVRPHD
jgi:hypothetical protein